MRFKRSENIINEEDQIAKDIFYTTTNKEFFTLRALIICYYITGEIYSSDNTPMMYDMTRYSFPGARESSVND